MNSLKPPLKWAGGKRWLLSEIQSIWLNLGEPRIIEPFCGGLAISLGLRPKIAIINDINPHLINFYKWIQKGFTFTPPDHFSNELFYKKRNRFNELILEDSISTKESAELFYFLNRTCYNGLCRFNKSGLFNVPIGRFKNVSFLTDFVDYKTAFGEWIFSSTSFENIETTQTDFIFADPPYDVDFRSYSKDGFSWKNQIAVIEWLDCHKGPIVLCNQATNRIVKLYLENGFDLHFLQEQIRISPKGERKFADVVLATKNLDPSLKIRNEVIQPELSLLA
ncbi:MAG TPA: adenine methyltransferase [Anaerolineaceae bacterium]|nr:adenine methyltransferase [Anaerolineaceae bacterium]